MARGPNASVSERSARGRVDLAVVLVVVVALVLGGVGVYALVHDTSSPRASLPAATTTAAATTTTTATTSSTTVAAPALVLTPAVCEALGPFATAAREARLRSTTLSTRFARTRVALLGLADREVAAVQTAAGLSGGAVRSDLLAVLTYVQQAQTALRNATSLAQYRAALPTGAVATRARTAQQALDAAVLTQCAGTAPPTVGGA